MEYKVIVTDEVTKWYNTDGERHREDGPAVEWAHGDKYWYINGKLHREDGPALEYVDGSKLWYNNGKLHRTDGPAVEWFNGDKFWYINGEKLTETKFNQRMNIVKELTVKELSNLLGYTVKVVQ